MNQFYLVILHFEKNINNEYYSFKNKNCGAYFDY